MSRFIEHSIVWQVRWLLNKRPSSVDSSNNDGRSSLHIAALNNNVEMCKILLDSKASVNPIMRNSKGHLMTPLDAALYRGYRGCAKFVQLHGGVPASKITDKSALQRAMARYTGIDVIECDGRGTKVLLSLSALFQGRFRPPELPFSGL